MKKISVADGYIFVAESLNPRCWRCRRQRRRWKHFRRQEMLGNRRKRKKWKRRTGNYCIWML